MSPLLLLTFCLMFDDSPTLPADRYKAACDKERARQIAVLLQYKPMNDAQKKYLAKLRAGEPVTPRLSMPPKDGEMGKLADPSVKLLRIERGGIVVVELEESTMRTEAVGNRVKYVPVTSTHVATVKGVDVKGVILGRRFDLKDVLEVTIRDGELHLTAFRPDELIQPRK